jgi:hypothetical protein
MTRVTFAAKVMAPPSSWVAWDRTPERLQAHRKPVCVKNPFTGYDLWLYPEQIVNIVNDVACVSFEAQQSARRKKITRGHREFINPTTGNTFLVHLSAIQETS